MAKIKSHKNHLIILLPLSLLLTYISSRFPTLIERFYSNGLYRLIGRGLSRATGIFPFSVGEAAVIVFVLLVITYLFRMLVLAVKSKEKRKFIIWNLIVNVLVIFSVVYFAFIITWGLNYYRLPFAEIIGLEVRPASVEELGQVCENLIERTNKLRVQTAESENGVMQPTGKTQDLFHRASRGYDNAARMIPKLGGRFGPPKGVLFSYQMSFTGITGVYFPFTGEANVNTNNPALLIPFTACHEMAHQRGFAREDEANYIAYLTCNLHPDTDFQYSGTLAALIHTMNMLQNYDIEKYNELRKGYSKGVIKDLNYISRFWQQFEGPIENMSNNINNLYLKSNRQKEGVYSYNRMVDLLIAEYRLKHAKGQ